MLNTPGKPLIVLLTCIMLLSAAACTSTGTTTAGVAATISRQVPVQRGDLVVSVSVDGNLEMPNYYNLRFNSKGEVKQVLVEEGDRVRVGQVLATLDDTGQRLDIKLYNNAVQKALSYLYETVPRLTQFPAYYYVQYPSTDPYFVPEKIIYDRDGKPIMASPAGIHNNPVYQMYYPNATILSSYTWAQEEVAAARGLLRSDNYRSASSELFVALSDLEACIKILEDTINNPESGLGNTAPLVDDSNYTQFSIQNDNSFAAYYIQALRKLVSRIRQGQSDIDRIRTLITAGKYDESTLMLDSSIIEIDDIGREIIINVNALKLRNDTTIYGKDISLLFYSAAEDKLNTAIRSIETDGLNSAEMNDNLRIARHYMQLCNGILGSNDYVLQHGPSRAQEQGYKLDVASALVDLDTKKNNFLNTFIWAPIDGTVVSVGVKEKDVLSDKDFSSRNAVVLVDTKRIEFWGTVDEIDIMKIKTGQNAIVFVDAVPNKTFTGKISFISPKGTADSNNIVKFNVTILLDPTGVELKGKLTATADVGISTVENTLLIPLSAVTTIGTSSSVTVVTDDKGQTEKRQVDLGIQNQQYVQILNGLNESDQVIIVDKASGAPVSTNMGPPGGGGGGRPPDR
jgi:multidrug efflux pump subunit AcrA (membrane-fusion protein)